MATSKGVTRKNAPPKRSQVKEDTFNSKTVMADNGQPVLNLGLGSQNDPIDRPVGSCGGKKVSCKFVVPRGDTPPVIDAAKVICDFVASSVIALGTIGIIGGVASGGDDRQVEE
jgi:hypothetical protein